MGWIQELGNEMSKSKTVKYLVITSLLVFCLVMGTIAFRLIRDTYRGNDAMKAGPVELPEIKTLDTQSSLSPAKRQDSPANKVKKEAVSIQSKEKKKEYPITQKNESGDNNQNSGNNSGIIGGKGNTINNIGSLPRHFTQNDFQGFYQKYPDKNIHITPILTSSPDAEMRDVRFQIIKLLQDSGYKNIETEGVRFGIGGYTPPKVDIEPSKDGGVDIYIPPK